MKNKLKILEAGQLESVLKISQAVSRTLDLDKIVDMACKMTAQALKADRCSIGLLYAKDNYEIVHAYRRKSSYPSISKARYDIRFFPHIASPILKGKYVHIINHKKSSLTKKENELFKGLNLKVFLGVPIVIGGKILGAMHPGKVEDHSHFSPSDISLCQTIANQVGIAINNAMLLKDLKDKFDQQNIILDISRSLFKVLNLHDLFNLIIRKSCETLNMDRCSICSFDPEKKQGIIRATYPSTVINARGTDKNGLFNTGTKLSIEDSPSIYQALRKKKFFMSKDFSKAPLSLRMKNHIKTLGVKSCLIVPILSRKEILGTIQFSTLKEPRIFTDSEIKLCQTIANLSSLAIENANLIQNIQDNKVKIEQQANTLEKQFKEQSILLEISKTLSQTLDLNKLFEIITKKSVILLGVDRSAVILLDETKELCIFYKVYYDSKHRPEYEGVQKKFSDFPKLIEQLKKENIFCTPDIACSILSPGEKNIFLNEGMKSLLVIPFFLKRKVLGLIALSTLEEYHSFTEAEIKLAQSIANQLSMAVENARLMEMAKTHSNQLKKLALKIINAQEVERKNIAGKLHDVIAQDLTAIQFDLKMCQQILPDKSNPIILKLKESEDLVGHSLENLRYLTSDLRPPVLDHFGLPSAIHWYVDNFTKRTGLKIDLKISESSCNFPVEFETAIYRIIQESLTNVAKHAKATRVSISLYKKGNISRIIIKDNGIGFEPDSISLKDGFGLIRLKENTELLGGKFKIISKSGSGTKLNITLPC